MPSLQQKIIRIAKAEIGTHEARVNGHWNNDVKYASEVPGLEWANFQPWCATFVSWVALQAGAANLYPSTASCDLGGAWFKKVGRWSDYPAIGAQVFMGTARDLNHTGIVVAYDADTITTVEGNTNTNGAREGDGVYLRTRLRRAANVIGYGYPDFPGGIKTADPAWVKGLKPGAVKKPVVKKPAVVAGNAARIDGIDLSHHNVGITLSGLKKAQAAGVKFVSHKATEGDGFTDSQFATRRRLVAQVDGLQFGGYHFARPASSSGTAQAKQFLAVAKPKVGDFLPALDLEDDGGRSLSELDAWVSDFVAEVNRQLGTTDGLIYTKFPLKSTHGWRLWVPRYNDAMALPVIPAPWSGFTIWQFSNGVFGHPDTVPGIGHCDINTLSFKPKTPFTRLQIKAPKVTPPVVVPPPVVEPQPPVVVIVKKPHVPTPPVGATMVANLQCNVQQTDPAAVGVAHVKSVAPLADLIGWNELGNLELQNAVRALPDHDSYLPGNPAKASAAAAVGISWLRAKYELLDSGFVKVHGGVPKITPSRFIIWVKLRERESGKEFWRINTHSVHHVEVAGLARVKGAITGQNARAEKHFAMLLDKIRELSATAPVIAGGDLNVDYLAEKHLAPSARVDWFPLTLIGEFAQPVMPGSHGTHGGRAIDWTFVTRRTVKPYTCVALPHGSSDHNPVLSTLELL